ncbi:MAG: 3-phosphoshikimate 1-carboxyvinyltransferase [Deltaproteobacteria bacterium]|nr:3-phosphoshikimate 1-carboxyvinyltransferase [Deltaproteobacteria bacterium]
MAESLQLRAPSSKSQTQRALVLAALAKGMSEVIDPLDCSDSRGLREALRTLGIDIDDSAPRCWRVEGGQFQAPKTTIDCLDGGTTARFVAALSLVLDGALPLDGSARLRERPMAPLIDSLRQLGVKADSESLPMTLQREGTPEKRVSVEAHQSSQFASALLMVAPLLPEGLELRLSPSPHDGAVSMPYLSMTVEMMAERGVHIDDTQDGFHVRPGTYQAQPITVEGDWSAAAFLLVAARLSGQSINVENMSPHSLQGDRAIVEMLHELDIDRAHHFDLSDCPDLLPPLAAACACCAPPTFIGGIGHARIKESDRVNAMAEGLKAVGVDAQEYETGLLVNPSGLLQGATIDPRDDHRIAMAFGLLSLKEPSIEVSDHRCVEKSFPDFWQQLQRFQ